MTLPLGKEEDYKNIKIAVPIDNAPEALDNCIIKQLRIDKELGQCAAAIIVEFELMATRTKEKLLLSILATIFKD